MCVCERERGRNGVAGRERGRRVGGGGQAGAEQALRESSSTRLVILEVSISSGRTCMINAMVQAFIIRTRPDDASSFLRLRSMYYGGHGVVGFAD